MPQTRFLDKVHEQADARDRIEPIRPIHAPAASVPVALIGIGRHGGLTKPRKGIFLARRKRRRCNPDTRGNSFARARVCAMIHLPKGERQLCLKFWLFWMTAANA